MPPLLRYFSPFAYLRKAREIWHRSRYDAATLRLEEEAKFTAQGFDLKRARVELNRNLSEMGLPSYEACGGMASVHWLLFACLGQTKSIRRILEIGTYDGQTTALLARLFPQSQIVTIDLPSSDPILANTYDYARGGTEKLRAFEQTLAANTSGPNIKLLRINSFFLPAEVKGGFDLIWVDGGHLYPEISWDLCNCYHLAGKGGIVMVDDIIPHPRGIRDAYVSPDAHAVLRYITERTRDPLQLFLKRESPAWSADPRSRKFVALLHKKRDVGE